ncbi:hypothetical protein [Halomonas urmiana]|uniref:hypothetical protein n=1 Tax=Halomonas urmiana TaxID=490901 RepID=UPI00130533BA|nr:hypothetical protein [Halomonas urmiana]
MTTFDSTKRSLPELLKDITNGKTPEGSGGAWRAFERATKLRVTSQMKKRREAP